MEGEDAVSTWKCPWCDGECEVQITLGGTKPGKIHGIMERYHEVRDGVLSSGNLVGVPAYGINEVLGLLDAIVEDFLPPVDEQDSKGWPKCHVCKREASKCSDGLPLRAGGRGKHYALCYPCLEEVQEIMRLSKPKMRYDEAITGLAEQRAKERGA